MTRLIQTKIKKSVTANLVTYFQDSTKESFVLKEGDKVDNLRCVKDESVINISGRIAKIEYYVKK